MGMMATLLTSLFGSGSNVLRDTATIWRENPEAAAIRAASSREAALGQLAAEFSRPQRGWFDGFVDGLNRLPRPMLALGVLGMFAMAMYDPFWFSQRMQGLALVPEPLWWLMGVIVSFYFGARHQAKMQDFQRQLASGSTLPAQTQTAAPANENAALNEWQALAKSTATK